MALESFSINAPCLITQASLLLNLSSPQVPTQNTQINMPWSTMPAIVPPQIQLPTFPLSIPLALETFLTNMH